MNKNMDKMFIELDKDKLKEYDISLDNATKYLDELFTRMNMNKNKDGWYLNGNFKNIGILTRVLINKKWFIDSINKWWWFQADIDAIEDIGSLYKNGVSGYVNTE